jgi:hypothetical protein
MGQRFSKHHFISTTAQQTFPPFMLSIFREFIILSMKDKNSQLILAKTCKTLYERYELHYKDKTAVVLYNPRREYDDFIDDIGTLQFHHGWLRLKFSSIRDSESSNYPKILCLNRYFDMPKESDYLCAIALIPSSSKPKYIELNASLEMFTRLKSLSLCNVNFDDVAFSIISNLLIEFIQLKLCKIDNHLVEKCTIPQIQLVRCKFSGPASIKLPLSLKVFKMSSQKSYKVDASNCIELESL